MNGHVRGRFAYLMFGTSLPAARLMDLMPAGARKPLVTCLAADANGRLSLMDIVACCCGWSQWQSGAYTVVFLHNLIGASLGS